MVTIPGGSSTVTADYLAAREPSRQGACPDWTAIRLDEPEQTDMVFGDGARDWGAACERIQQPSTATRPDSNEHELPTTPSWSWDSTGNHGHSTGAGKKTGRQHLCWSER
jgi:hypothetical protein